MSRPRDGSFPTTQWTLIERLKHGESGIARRALDDLCAQYHYPLYCIIRRRGLEHHDAQDALHDFLAKLLRLGSFADADAGRGRLRSFLCAALQRFLINWQRDRPHRQREVSLELPTAGPEDERRFRAERFSEEESPERLFDRKWGQELIQRVLHAVEEKYAARGRSPVFSTLRPVLLAGGSLRGEDSSKLAASLGLSEGSLRAALLRLLQEFRATLEAEVSQTVASRESVGEEIALLLTVFRRE